MNIMESFDGLWPGLYLGILRPWAQENFAVTVTCVKNGFQKAFNDTSTPEIEDHKESTSENELSDVPEGIINKCTSFI
jgi:hypothetical protein